MVSMLDQYDLRKMAFTAVFILGALIVFYGVLWLLVNLGVIPAIIAAIFPQIILIIIGIFIMYTAFEQKKKYY
jgi:lipopolysaccharide export LptBFGC system permease protein LptF